MTTPRTRLAPPERHGCEPCGECDGTGWMYLPHEDWRRPCGWCHGYGSICDDDESDDTARAGGTQEETR